MKANWSKVNAIHEKMTGKPVKTEAELKRFADEAIAKIRRDTNAFINRSKHPRGWETA